MSELNLKEVERVGEISSGDFFENYIMADRPVVLKDFAKEWPALKKWTPEYFKRTYGGNEVKVFSEDFSRPGKTYMGRASKMSFGGYLDSILKSGRMLRMFLYNIVSHCPELKQDVILPELVKGLSKRFLFLFFGPKGAITQIHYDIDMSHVFHTAIKGRKRFVLFPQRESKNLYRHPFTIRSYINVDKPDFDRFPKMKEAKGYEVTIEPGETLFIPAGYWHHVVYEDAGYAISLRCPHHSWAKRLEGMFNVLIMQMVDRFVNKIAPQKWFHWKESRAKKLAEV